MPSDARDLSAGLAAVAIPDVSAADRLHALASRLWQIDRRVVVTVAVRMAVIAAGIVTSILSARFLQPAGRGEYFMIVTAAQLLAQFGNLGLSSSNTFFVAGDRTLLPALVANSIWVSFLAVPLVGLMLLTASSAFGWSVFGQGGSWFALALAPLILFNLLGSNLLVGLNQMNRFNAVQFAGAVVLLPFMLGAGLLRLGPHGFLGASIAGWGLTAVVTLVLLRRGNPGPLRFQPAVFRSTLTYSLRAYLATMAGFLVLRINVFTLSGLVGSQDVGYYSVASQIADTVAVLPQSIALVLFPSLVGQASRRFRATLDSMLTTALLMAVICAGLWVAGGPAIRTAFGHRFDPAVPVLRSMLPAIFLLGVTSVLSQYLAASGMPISVVATWAAGVGLTASLGPALIRRYAGVGAGITLSATYLVIFVVLFILSWRAEADADSSR